MFPLIALKLLTDWGEKKTQHKPTNTPVHLVQIVVRHTTANTCSDTQFMNCSLSLPHKINTSGTENMDGETLMLVMVDNRHDTGSVT